MSRCWVTAASTWPGPRTRSDRRTHRRDPRPRRIAAYDRNGNLLQDYTASSKLQQPWGMAIAPDSFGALAQGPPVGGQLQATAPSWPMTPPRRRPWLYEGRTRPALVIDGIWGLAFGNGVALGDANALYYTAGPDEERDGVFGRINLTSAVPEPQSWALMLAGGLWCCSGRDARTSAEPGRYPRALGLAQVQAKACCGAAAHPRPCAPIRGRAGGEFSLKDAGRDLVAQWRSQQGRDGRAMACAQLTQQRRQVPGCWAVSAATKRSKSASGCCGRPIQAESRRPVTRTARVRRHANCPGAGPAGRRRLRRGGGRW